MLCQPCVGIKGEKATFISVKKKAFYSRCRAVWFAPKLHQIHFTPTIEPRDGRQFNQCSPGEKKQFSLIFYRAG